ncbi:unnamed protein product [Vitrella brassicaformis CCMP3155]|uniref:Uncharacterized protein n=1 Tax=Vitrella brassicaformis (strain CCMP3155) TaxID=1169540 RepID=A0A0G4EXQ2_VITBC|nr:unnamed protein product [Vitrella brassicaformis CCMP3155]|eukprot:CEM03389.1 unnamed protein product [Vitrella brassicaformis CCMP3155]
MKGRRAHPSVMGGKFQEGQERQVCIEKISRPIGEVVLQQEMDIVSSLTKDNLLEAMIALDYLQFDVDQIFVKGSTQSLLWRSHAHPSQGRGGGMACRPSAGEQLARQLRSLSSSRASSTAIPTSARRCVSLCARGPTSSASTGGDARGVRFRMTAATRRP